MKPGAKNKISYENVGACYALYDEVIKKRPMKDGLNVLLYARSKGRRRHLAFLHNTQING